MEDHKMNRIYVLALIFLLSVNVKSFAQWETIYHPNIVELPLLNDVVFKDYNNGVAVGYGDIPSNGYIIRTKDGGITWDTVWTQTPGAYYSVAYSDSNQIKAVGRDGMITTVTMYDSTHTVFSTQPVAVNLYDIVYTSGGVLPTEIPYIVGENGTFLSGTNYLQLPTFTNLDLHSIVRVNDSLFFICGDTVILKGDFSWIKTYIGSGNSSDIFFSSDSIGYFYSGNVSDGYYELFKTTDQGVNWNLHATITTSWILTSMFFTNDTTGYITGQFTMLKTTDGGLTWANQSAGPPPNYFFDDITQVFFLNNDTGFAVGYFQFFKTTNAGGLVTENEELSEKNSHMKIYPNPNTGIFTLEIKLNNPSDLLINVYKLDGQMIFTDKVRNIYGNYNQKIDLNKYAKGIYYLQFMTDDIVFTEKIVHQ